MKTFDAVRDIDGRNFYCGNLSPFETFNNIEITLSHIFRRRTPVLGNRNYSDCLLDFLMTKGAFRDRIIEIGCGLGDLAANLLVRSDEITSRVESYLMYDISCRLLEYEQARLSDSRVSFLEADCLNFSRRVPAFDGLIISNGMLADLRSVLIDSESTLSDYGIADPDLEDFYSRWGAGREPYYGHVGTLQFLREIASALRPPGIAILAEYSATQLNQPSWFAGHFECGIDFDQVEAYARRIGFVTQLVDIEDILGIERDSEFLSMDVFTLQDRIAREVPASVKLWQTKNPLPVHAYSRETMAMELASERGGLSGNEAATLVESLDDLFHTIHDPRFDHKNPTTWGYRCLLLAKSESYEIPNSIRELECRILSRALSVDLGKARGLVKGATEDVHLGIDTTGALDFLLASIMSGMLYDLVRQYGETAWRFFFIDHLRKRVEVLPIKRDIRQNILEAAREEIDRLTWR